jgi:hypothetical protein
MILRWCATTQMAPWIPALMGMAKSSLILVRAVMTMGQAVIQQVDGKLVVAGYRTPVAIMILHWRATTPMVL